MTYKVIFIFITFLFVGSLFSQNQNTEVVYKFMLVKNAIVSSKKTDYVKNTESEFSKIAQTLKPRLVFNDTIGSFYCDDLPTGVDEFRFTTAKIFCNCNEPIIYNKTNDKIYYNFEGNPLIDQEYTVYESLTKNWKLTKETKKIDKYTCYKATAIVEEYNMNGTIFKNVVAWYCPELPFSFGPNGYGSLPGLILELQEDENFYGMESIKIKSSDAKIQTIKRYKLKQKDDYFKLIDETIAKYKNRN